MGNFDSKNRLDHQGNQGINLYAPILNKEPEMRSPSDKNQTKWKQRSKSKVKIGKSQRKAKLEHKIINENELLPEGVSCLEELKDIHLNRKKKEKSQLDNLIEWNTPTLFGGNWPSITLSNDNKFLVSVTNENLFTVFELEQKKVILSFEDEDKSEEDWGHQIVVSESFEYVILAVGGDLKAFSLTDGQKIFWKKNFHNGIIYSLLISKNYLITGSDDGSIKIFDLLTHKESYQFVNSTGIYCLTFTNDQTCLISGLEDGSVKIFDFVAKKEICHLRKVHKDTIVTVTVTSDDEYLITGSDDYSIKITNLKTKEVLHHFEDVYEEWITAIIVSKDSKNIYSLGDGSIKILDMETGREIYCFDIFGENVYSIILSKDGRYLLSASDSIMIFDIQTQEKVYLKDDPIQSVSFSKDNKYVVSGSKSGKIKVYDFHLRSKTPLLLDCDEETVFSLVISSTNKYFISGCKRSIRIFDLTNMKQIHEFPMTEAEDRQVDISNDEKFVIASSSNSSVVKIFDIEKLQETKETSFGCKKIYLIHFGIINLVANVCSICLSHDSSYIIVGLSDENGIKVIDFQTHDLIFHFKSERHVKSLALSHDNKLMISIHEKGLIKTFDLENFQLMYYLDFKEQAIKVALTKDNRFFILSLEKSIKMLDLRTGLEIHCFKNVPFGRISTTCLSNDNHYIVSGAYGGDLKVIRLERKKKEPDNFKVSGIKDMIFFRLLEDVQWAIFGYRAGLLIPFDLLKKEEIYRINFEGTIENLRSSNSPYLLFLGENIKGIQVFNFYTRIQEKSLEAIGEESIRSFVVSKNNEFIAAKTDRNSLILFDFEKKQEKWKIKTGQMGSIAISNNNKYVILSDFDKGIQIYDLHIAQLIYFFQISGVIRITSIGTGSLIVKRRDVPIMVLDIETRQSFTLENLVEWYPKLSKNQKYFFFAKEDSIRMVDVYTGIELQMIKREGDEGDGFSIFSDNKHIVTETSIKETCFNYTDEIYVSSNKPIDSIFASRYDDFITSLSPIDPEIQKRFFFFYQDMFVIPYHWTVLHLLAIFNPPMISQIPDYSQFQVPFLLDDYGKTPLHYLIAQKSRDFSVINIMLKYIIDYVENLIPAKVYERQKICSSLSSCFYFIITKLSPNLIQKYLNLCYPETCPQFGQVLPSFGFSEQKYIFSPIPTIDPSILPRLHQEGDDRIIFRANLICLDYNPRSDDMLMTTHVLSEIKEVIIFKCPLIENLIDHLWESTNTTMYLIALAYSALMIQISLYIGSGQESILLETNILILTFLFLISELIQAVTLQNEYFSSVWNWLDLTQLLLTLAFIFTKLHNGEIFWETWIISAIIIAGYLRWLSYLRLFTPTRILIEIILAVMYDMLGFISVIASILVGFSLIFLEFGRNEPDPQKYGFHFYTTFKLLFGDYDDSGYTLSETILVSVLMCVLNVVLLNLLIAIIGDSFSKVNEGRDLVDAKTRLDMILETIVVMRYTRPAHKFQKCYLIYRLPALADERNLENKEWEVRINKIEKALNQNKDGEQSNIKSRKQMIEIKQEIVKQSNQVKQDAKLHKQSLEHQINQIKENFEHIVGQNTQRTEEKIALIRDEVKEMKENVQQQMEQVQEFKQLINLVLKNQIEGITQAKQIM